MEERVLEAIEIARLAVEIASDKQADNIVMLDTKETCSFADYFVICSGDSSRQVEAIWREICEVLKRGSIIPYHVEGTADSGWVLVDLGEVIVHIFTSPLRDYYQLDSLWSQAIPIIRLQ